MSSISCPDYEAILNRLFNYNPHKYDSLDKNCLLKRLKRYTAIHHSLHKSYAQKYHPGSVKSFLDSGEYQRWINTPSERFEPSRTLVCPGAPGVGKTILASAVIEDLKHRFASSDGPKVGIAYLYCDFGLQEEQTGANLLFSLYLQLGKQENHSRWCSCGRLFEDLMMGIRVPADKIGVTLSEIIAEYTRVFVIVDALDECDQEHRCALLKVIFRLQELCVVHLFATFNHGLQISTLFAKADMKEIRAGKEEVRVCLGDQLSRTLPFARDNPELEAEIMDVIAESAHGSFLIAQLCLEYIGQKKSIEDVQEALVHLANSTPNSGNDDHLHDHIYEILIKAVEDQVPLQAEFAKRALLYITLAKRSLTSHELQHAIALDAEDGEPAKSAKAINDEASFVDNVIHACRGLVITQMISEVDADQPGENESVTFRLVHHTAQDSLRRTLKRWFPTGDIKIAKTCMAVLSSKFMETDLPLTRQELEHRFQTFPFYSYAASHWGHHVREAFKDSLDGEESEHNIVHLEYLVPNFLGSQSNLESATQALFLDERHVPEQHNSTTFPRWMGPLHVAGYFGLTSMIDTLLSTGKGKSINARDSFGRTALAWASAEGYEKSVAQLLLGGEKVKLDTRDRWGRTPISLAAEWGHTAVVETLLRHGANPDLRDFDAVSPLLHATQYSHYAVIELLIRHGVDVNAEGLLHEEYNTPLSLAATQGSEDIVRLLLSDKNIEPHRNPDASQINRTPLLLAAERGHGNIVEILLCHAGGDQSQYKDGLDKTPLHAAARNGHEDVVRLILCRGFNANAQDSAGNTPLLAAIERGQRGVVGVVTTLLAQPEAEIMLELADSYGRTPLLMAIEENQAKVFRLLLAHKANIHARNDKGQTPLCIAALHGFVEGVEQLLAMDDVNPNDQGNDGCTPLILVLRNSGSLEARQRILRCLLGSKRVDPNICDANGETPISYAIQIGLPSLYRTLLQCDQLDVNIPDQHGETLLFWAARDGDEDVVATLLARGANPNVQNNCGETPLGAVARNPNGKPSIAKLLLSQPTIEPDARDDEGATPLSWALANTNMGMVELLLNTGRVNVNNRDKFERMPLHYVEEGTIFRKSSGAVRLLLKKATDLEVDAKDSKGRTPLSIAADCGVADNVAALLDTGKVDVNSQDEKGMAPLHYAAMEGNSEMAERILEEKGVDPNCRDAKGRTPLSIAAEYGNPCFLDNLQQFQSSHNSPAVLWDSRDNTGRTPLSWAVGSPAEIVGLSQEKVLRQLLLIHNVDPDTEDDEGRTPLWWAVEAEHARMVDAFLEYGGDKISPGHVDKNGHTPLMLAMEKKNEPIERLLQKAGTQMDLQQPRDEVDDAVSLGSDISGPADAENKSSSSKGKWSVSSSRTQDIGNIELKVDYGHDDQTDQLCRECNALDIGSLLARLPEYRADKALVAKLGKVDDSWESRSCPMCRLMAAVRPGLQYSTSERELSVFSGAKELPQYDLHIDGEDWFDTAFLGVFPVEEEHSKPLEFGFIGLVGCNKLYNSTLIVNQLQANVLDYSKMRSWIDYCTVYHDEQCNGHKPQRPIPHLCLIDCESPQLAVVSIDSSSVTDILFVALSYVWGSQPNGPDTTDYDHVEQPQAVVEDAITVTRKLGYRYLWVDRYCTIKSDKKIFKAQLQSMNSIYELAQVTIVAAAGADPSFGLPGVSERRPMKRFPCIRIKGCTLAAIPPGPYYDIPRSTWWTRGWTFQEGILSRRRLVFTDKEVSYECQGMVIREAIELPSHLYKSPNLPDSHGWLKGQQRTFPNKGIRSYIIGWNNIWPLVAQYTACKLTYDSDILNAFLGILQVFSEREPPIQHVCGIPITIESTDDEDSTDDQEHDLDTLPLQLFVRGLCWHLSKPGTRREGFPSWSWTGWHGQVDAGSSSDVTLDQYGSGCSSIEVDFVHMSTASQTISWETFETLDSEAKTNLVLQQSYRLQITASVVEVNLWQEKKRRRWEMNTYGDIPETDETEWHAAICLGKNKATGGTLYLCKDPTGDNEFHQRLVDERWLAIVMGSSNFTDEPMTTLLLVDKARSGHGWERIGLIRVWKALEDLEAFPRRTFLLE